jgi:nitrogen regulatory protein P-II 1
VISVVKELSIYLFTEAIPTATEILRKHGIGGLAFYELCGTGRTRRHEIPELVFRGARAYQTGRRITPEFEKRTKIETFVPDSSAKEIVDELISSFGSDSEPSGMVFVKEVADAYEIGSKQSGEAILTAK